MAKAYRILVVDDSPDNGEAVAAILRADGYLVEVAVSGIEAMERSISFVPDVFLIDVVMPGMDGLTLLRKINVREEFHEAVIMTGNGNLEDARKAMELGALSYLLKPVRREELREQVLRALASCRHKRERSRYQHELQCTIAERTTELRKALSIAENQSRRLDTIMNSMAEGLLVVDKEYSIVLMNSRAERILDRKFGECAAQDVRDVLGQSDLLDIIIRAMDAEAPSPDTQDSSLGLMNEDGFFRVGTRVLHDESNRRIGVIITLLDWTLEIQGEQLCDALLAAGTH